MSLLEDEGPSTDPLLVAPEDDGNDENNPNRDSAGDDGVDGSGLSKRDSFIVEFAKTKGPPQITILMVLVSIGAGSTIGVVPAVMADRFARLNHGYDSVKDCSSYTSMTDKPEACLLGFDDAQNAAASSNLVSNVLTFFSSSLVGSLSDEYGRRGILIFGLFLSTVPPFILYLLQLVPSISPWVYYSTNAATGFVSWSAVALSALADVLPPQLRAPGIGILLSGFMLGFALAPVLAVFLNRRELSLISFLMVLLGFVVTVLVLPETLPPDAAEAARRRHTDTGEDSEDRSDRRNWMKTVWQYLVRPLAEMAILNRDTFFRMLSILAFFSGMVSSGDQVLLVYYLEQNLYFTERDVSAIFLIIGVVGLFAQAVMLKPLNDCFGEKFVIALCFFVGSLVNITYGLATTKATIYTAVVFSSFTLMAYPTISAIKANNVDPSEQGRIQGALYSLQALASGVGPVALRFVYSQAKETFLGGGAMFVFAGCLYFVVVAVACALPKERTNTQSNRSINEPLLLNDDGADDGIHIEAQDIIS